MLYTYLKALHIIFMVTWFAGLFYMVRLFIYQIEALEKPEPEKTILGNQLKLMARRLWNIITVPGSILTLTFGLWMLIENPALLKQPWMHIKLTFVVVLFAYMFKCNSIYSQLQKDVAKYSSYFMRIFNEVATLLLFAIVFLAVLKHSVNWFFATLGLIFLAVLLMLGIRLYKKLRNRKS
ncbi:MAG TPA: CopD family protein [Flavobacteriaceae bacterium]|nr:CopD family protein [Flavobacteriaceae bacterium]